MESLKATGTEGEFFVDWSGRYAKSMNAEQELGVYKAFLSVVPTLLSAMNTVAISRYITPLLKSIGCENGRSDGEKGGGAWLLNPSGEVRQDDERRDVDAASIPARRKTAWLKCSVHCHWNWRGSATT